MNPSPVHQKLDSYFRKFTPSHFKKGDLLIAANATPRGIYFIRSGLVRQFIFTSSSLELTLHFFKPNSFFPLLWAINNLPNRFYYQAFTPLEVHLAPKEDLLKFLRSDPQILFDLASRLLFGLDGLLTRVESLASANARQRTIEILLFLGKHFGTIKEKSLLLTRPFTHTELANLTCLSRETTSRQMEQLAKEGLISIKNRQIFIPDLQKIV